MHAQEAITRAFLGVSLSALLSGCGDATDELPLASLARDLPIAFSLPSRIAADVEVSRTLVLETAFRATGLAGLEPADGLVRTGTLDVVLDAYRNRPTDRLTLRQANREHVFEIERLEGNEEAPSAAAWQMLPHALRYTHRVEGEHELEVAVDYDGSSFEVRVRGWTILAGRRIELELAAVGSSPDAREFRGREVRTEVTLSGRLTAGELEVEVLETHASALLGAGDGKPRRLSPTMVDSTISSSLDSGGSRFLLDRVRLRTEPSGATGPGADPARRLVLVDGRFLREATPLGRCALSDGLPVLRVGDVVLRLDLESGLR